MKTSVKRFFELETEFYANRLLNWLFNIEKISTSTGGGPRGVMVKTMDSGIVVHEFVHQSRYYVHFRANTLILPAMG